ncbi:MAG: leucine--tRNA ligase, partial [Candidatus Aenigmatarchaeota archaeon]
KGEHPVVWCPSCKNPVGEHDILEDKKAGIEDFTLIKFKLEDKILPAATLRPETIFGVTNLWINPEGNYVEAKVNNEIWIISEKALEKIRLQGRKTKLIKRFMGNELIGKSVIAPITNAKIKILPADFVDTNNATGVVYSCPAHAPYDWIALKDLGKNYDADKIKPISLIKTQNYGEFPGVEMCEKFNIKNQHDKRLEKITQDIYSDEFHGGITNKNTGKYANMPVAEAKNAVKEDLIKTNQGEVMFEVMNKPIVCRCNTECVIKIIKDQWFIDYGNEEWKRKTHELIDKIKIIPENTRREYHNTVDWLHERACARRHGFGTRLPMDPDWIIESLSDSTIYMAYYTIAGIINEKKIKPDALKPEVFDFIFLGRGSIEEISKKAQIDKSTLEDMRNEFMYWYPLDSRHSATDLISNHLIFFLMNHIAIFPKEAWPKQIVTNGFVLHEGQKMSKSLGNIIPLRHALKKYGADVIRVCVLCASGLEQDANFTETLANTIRNRIYRLFDLANEAKSKKIEYEDIDLWIISRMNACIKEVTKAMNEFRFRDALNYLLFLFDKDISWYMKRSENRSALNLVMRKWVTMLAPFIPHTCEELWERFGNMESVHKEKWPAYEKTKKVIEKREEYLENLISDIKQVMKLSKIKKPVVYIYTANEQSWKILKTLKENNGDIEKTIEKFGKDVAPVIKLLAKRWNYEIIEIDEADILKKERNFLEREINAKILINEESNFERKKIALPYKPAIYIIGD